MGLRQARASVVHHGREVARSEKAGLLKDAKARGVGDGPDGASPPSRTPVLRGVLPGQAPPEDGGLWRTAPNTTKGPMWGYPRCGLGAVGAVLQPFCGHLSPKFDRVPCKLTFEIPPRRTLGVEALCGELRIFQRIS